MTVEFFSTSVNEIRSLNKNLAGGFNLTQQKTYEKIFYK